MHQKMAAGESASFSYTEYSRPAWAKRNMRHCLRSRKGVHCGGGDGATNNRIKRLGKYGSQDSRQTHAPWERNYLLLGGCKEEK